MNVEQILRTDPPQVQPPATIKGATVTIDARAKARQRILSEYLEAAKDGRISFLKFYRLRKGLDQAELGKRVDMKQSAIARAERPGQTANMKAASVKKLANALGVSMEDLLR